MSEFDFSFKHPTTILVSGPSGYGKTQLVLRILEHEFIKLSQTQIVWVYAEDQPAYIKAAEINPNIELILSWSDKLYDQFMINERNLFIVDNQIDEAMSSKTLTNLFTKGSHQRNLMILCLLQIIYNSGSSQRTVSLKTNYNIVFRN